MLKTIGDVCQLLNGYSFKSEKYVDSGIRIIRIANVQKGFIEDNSPAFYPLETPGIENYMLKEGDLLISLTGNVGRVALLNKEMLPAALNQRVACLRIKDDSIYKNFLFHYLNSSKFENTCILESRGVAQKNMSTEWLKRQPIPNYTLQNQIKISKILDSIIEIINKKRQQLVEFDSLIKSRFVEMFDGKGLPVLKWNDVFNTTTGKLDSNAMVDGGQYPFFTCAKEIYAIDKYAFDKEALLLAGNNAAGKYDVKYYKGKFNAYQRTYVLDLKQNWSYQLFKYQLEDKLEFLREQSKGSNTRYITLKILADLDFIIPPLEKQVEFEKFCNHVDKLKFENEILYSIYRFTINKQTKLLSYRGVTL
jgi:restriction endonuclease S subunit